MSYKYGAHCKARNFNVVYIYIYMYIHIQVYMDIRLATLFLIAAQCFSIESMQKVFLYHSCV
jgi:hypothetical protein